MLSVETGEFLRSAQDVGDLVVGVAKGLPVYLREVARIETGAATAQRYVWHTPGGAATPAWCSSEWTEAAPGTAVKPGGVYPAVTITVTKKPGENAVDVARAVRERLRPWATP
jgi:multidrug efflux pump subunit AcrB